LNIGGREGNLACQVSIGNYGRGRKKVESGPRKVTKPMVNISGARKLNVAAEQRREKTISRYEEENYLFHTRTAEGGRGSQIEKRPSGGRPTDRLRGKKKSDRLVLLENRSGAERTGADERCGPTGLE